MNVSVLLNTKEDILKKVGNRAVLDHSNCILLEVNGAQNRADYKLLQNISFVRKPFEVAGGQTVSDH